MQAEQERIQANLKKHEESIREQLMKDDQDRRRSRWVTWSKGRLNKLVLTLETGISANFDVRRNVVPPWRVRQAHSGRNSPMTSQNVNAKQSRKVASSVRFRHILHILGKNEKNNQSPNWGRDSGIPSSCPRFATSTTRQVSSWIANLGHSDGIPSSLPQCGVRFY